MYQQLKVGETNESYNFIWLHILAKKEKKDSHLSGVLNMVEPSAAALCTLRSLPLDYGVPTNSITVICYIYIQ